MTYCFECLDDLTINFKSFTKYDKERLYRAYGEYSKNKSNFSFNESCHIFTGKMESLIKNNFFIKDIPYTIIELKVSDDTFTILAKTSNNSDINKIIIK